MKICSPIRAVSSLLALGSATFVTAQIILPTYPPSVSGSRVKGLSYDATVTGGQSVSFTFTAGGGSPTSANWSVDGVAVASGPTTYTYKAVGVGKHFILCKSITASGLKMGGLSFAAIGGPLGYDVSKNDLEADVPAHDHNISTEPFHLQYFEYVYPPNSTISSVAQKEQTGVVHAAGGQLDGTKYNWHFTGPAVAWGGTDADTSSTVFVAPTGGSTPGQVKVRLTYSYTDPDSDLSGTADDDSEETPPPGLSATFAEYYSFTSHKPTNVEVISTVPGTHYQGDNYLPALYGWTYQNYFIHRLFDSNYEGQPGVWVTERFPESDAELAAFNNQTGQFITLENAESLSVYWKTVMSAYGDFNGADQIGLSGIFGNAAHPYPGLYPALVFSQEYYAATSSTALGAFGVFVKSWTNTCTTTSVSHDGN